MLDRHEDYAKEWEALGARGLTLYIISYEPQINSRTVQGERPGTGARDGERDTWGNRTREKGDHGGGQADGSRPGNGTLDDGERNAVPEETWADVGDHGFWKQGMTPLFDVRIINLYADSYFCMTPEKALAKAYKEKKDKYFQPCLERRCHFTPFVFSSDEITGP